MFTADVPTENDTSIYTVWYITHAGFNNCTGTCRVWKAVPIHVAVLTWVDQVHQLTIHKQLADADTAVWIHNLMGMFQHDT